MTPSSGQVTLPAGVTVAYKRETSQPGPSGQIVQGINFGLDVDGQVTTSLFIPYALLGNTDAITSAIAQRVASIRAIG